MRICMHLILPLLLVLLLEEEVDVVCCGGSLGGQHESMTCPTCGVMALMVRWTSWEPWRLMDLYSTCTYLHHHQQCIPVDSDRWPILTLILVYNAFSNVCGETVTTKCDMSTSSRQGVCQITTDGRQYGDGSASTGRWSEGVLIRKWRVRVCVSTLLAEFA